MSHVRSLRMLLALSALAGCSPSPDATSAAEIVAPLRPLEELNPVGCPTLSGYAAAPPVLYESLSPATILPPGTVSACPNSQCADHKVYVPANLAAAREPLVVMLPGSGMEPDKVDLVLQMAAYAGYRTVGLSYSNSPPISSLCAGARCTTTCFGDKRQEVIDGTLPGGAARNVELGDTILYRLLSTLTELDALHPFDGWDRYFIAPAAGSPPTMANIVWSEVIIAGFSQGAGHALKIAHDQLVQGSLALDGGSDECTPPGGAPITAGWYTATANVSAARPHRAVIHRHGQATFVVPPGLTAWGFVATATFLDSVLVTVPWWRPSPPAEVSYTGQVPAASCPVFLGEPEHNSMARDRCMPTTSSSALEATAPNTAHLGPYYVRRFCQLGD